MPELLNVNNLKTRLAHPGFRRYFKNTGWMFVGQAFNLLVAFFVGAYVARYLGPANFGLMNYAISFSLLFSFLAGFGIDTILNRDLVKFPEKQDELLGTGFWIKLGGGLLAAIIINLISFLATADILTRLLILIFSLTFVWQSFSVISIFFQARVLSKKTVSVQVFVTLVSSLVKISFIFLNLGVIWLMAVYVLDAVNLALGLFFLYQRSYKKSFFRYFDFSLSKTLLKNSWPLMLTSIAVVIYSKIDQIFIKQLLDATALGLYAISSKLTEICYYVPAIICSSLFPAMINAMPNPKIYHLRLKRLLSLLFVLAVGLAIFLFLVAKPMIIWLFGGSYALSVATFRVYIWSIIPSFVMVAISYYLIAENLVRVYLYMTVIGAVANVVLNLFLIPRAGLIGGALATLISYSLVPLSLVLFPAMRKRLKSLTYA